MSQIPLRSVRLNARPATTLESFVGTAGEIFYDSTNQTLRVYPGNIAAGKILADRDWVNSAVAAIGSSSLVNGTRTVSLSTAGSLTIPGDIRSESNINIEINLADSTLRRWQFGEDGNLTFPDGTNQSTAWTGIADYNNLINKPDLAGTYQFSVAADDSTQRVINTDELVKFIGAGGITTASDAEGNITINYVQGDIRSESNINIDINLSDSTLRRWQFGEDGILTAPGAIDAPSIFTNLIDSADSSAITMTPAVIFNSDVTVENDLVAKNIVFLDNSVQTTAWTGIPGPYANDAAAAVANVAVGSPYYKTGTGGQVFVRLT